MRKWLDFFHEHLVIHVDQDVPDRLSWHTQVKLWGVLDISTCQWTQGIFDEVLDPTHEAPVVGPRRTATDGPRWVVDTAEVEFLSAGGLRVLEDTAARCRGAGGGLEMVRPSRSVRLVLAFTDQLDTVADSRSSFGRRNDVAGWPEWAAESSAD
jgi:hypothetical protein